MKPVGEAFLEPAWRRGKRAGLITPRSLDRNGLPVLPSNRIGASRRWSNQQITYRRGAEEARCKTPSPNNSTRNSPNWGWLWLITQRS